MTPKETQINYAKVLKQFLATITADCDQWPETCTVAWLTKMCDQLINHNTTMSETKCGRWIGYIQGVLTARGLTTVEDQRRLYKQAKQKQV